MHAGQLRYHDFTLLREAREQRKLRQRLSSTVSPITTNFSLLGKQQFSLSTPSTTARFFGGLSTSSNGAMYNNVSLGNSSLGLGRGGSPLQHTTLGGSSSILNPITQQHQSQSRSFLTNLKTDLHLKQLERIANSSPQNVQAQLDFLSELSQSYPDAVIMRFEQFTDFAIDERIALLYLNALQRCGMQNKFGLRKFVERLQGSGVNSEVIGQLQELSGEKLKRGDVAGRASRLLSSAAGSNRMGGMMGGGSGAGSSPHSPLFVQSSAPRSGRAMFFDVAQRVLIAFVVVSALSVVVGDMGMGGGGGMRAMGNGKHIQEAEGTDVRFDDVKGVAEAKAELEEIVLYLKDPERFTRLGGKLPRGLLLTGPPGTGKTMLAKAIAGEAGVPFFFASGSQFEEVYVGLGAKRVRELFEAAKQKNSAVIIFIDEIDAVGGSRKLKDQSALKMTLNELLVQMDGFEANSGIIVIGATNFAESLDSALTRPGRFDKQVAVPLPDVGGRKEILEMYAEKTKIAKDVDMNILARGTTGMSGADLYNVMNQAAVKASVDGLDAITMEVFEWAKDKIFMGAERKSAVITPQSAKNTAYHEAGHALVGVLTEGSRTIHKATIMPRGNSLGMVMTLPDDETSWSYKQMVAQLDICMGGRIAEELIFGAENVTSGASSDIQQATSIARGMVTKYGFSDEVGIVYFGGNTGQEDASGKTRSQIDDEVKRLTSSAYERARNLLTKHSKEHKLLAETLLEYETLTGDEIRDLVLHGKKPDRPAINTDGSRGDQSVIKKKKTEKKSKWAGLADKVRRSGNSDEGG